MKNIFTVDLEDWYHANYSGNPTNFKNSRVEKPTIQLLDLLDKTKNKATFFVLGEIAKSHSHLIKEIKNRGHEIASHSYSHNLVYGYTKKEFKTDLLKSIEVIENITNQKPIGFRAPSWSVDKIRTPWYWQTLKELGFQYSSSLFPYKTFLYGDSKAEMFLHKIDGVHELPPSVVKICGTRIPFSGGFYLRILPEKIIKFFTYKTNKNNKPVVFYVHPREIDPNQPKIKDLKTLEKFIHYYGIINTYSKLETLLNSFSTISIESYLSQKNL